MTGRSTRIFVIVAMLSLAFASTSDSSGFTGKTEKKVIVTELHWYSPLGALNGCSFWKKDEFLYAASKGSYGVKNYPVVQAPVTPSGPAPQPGSPAYTQLQRQLAQTSMRQMKEAGIDVVAYDMLPIPTFNPVLPISWSNQPFCGYLDFLVRAEIAASLNMEVALFADQQNRSGDFPSGRKLNVSEWRTILTAAAKDLNTIQAAWRINGKPVVMHFGTDITTGAPPKPDAPPPDGGWRAVLGQKGEQGRLPIHFFADIRPSSTAADWSNIADSVHMFSPGAPTTFLSKQQTDFMKKFGNRYVWCISPGYYNASVNAYVEPSFSRLHATYSAAIQTNAQYINLATWNDFGEDTDICPSDNKSDALLSVIGFYNEWFKKGQMPLIKDSRIVIAYPKRIPNKVTTQAPDWNLYKSPPYSAKLFYWAALAGPSTVTFHSGKMQLPSGISYGEITLPGPGKYHFVINNKPYYLREINQVETEMQRTGNGGLEYQYQKLTFGTGA